jgi:hypothetical protein
MPTSDEDLQKKAERVQKLREQVTNAEATRVQREADLANDITMRQLEAEEAALEARLAVAKEAGKVANVKQGAAAPLDAVTEQMERAVAQQKAAEAAPAEAARATESTSSGGASGDSAATTGATTENGGK